MSKHLGIGLGIGLEFGIMLVPEPELDPESIFIEQDSVSKLNLKESAISGARTQGYFRLKNSVFLMGF